MLKSTLLISILFWLTGFILVEDKNYFGKYDIEKGFLCYEVESFSGEFEPYRCYIYFKNFGADETIVVLKKEESQIFIKKDSIQFSMIGITDQSIKSQREINFILEKFILNESSYLYKNLKVNKCLEYFDKKMKLQCKECYHSTFDNFKTIEGKLVFYKGIPIKAKLVERKENITLVDFRFDWQTSGK